MNDAQNVINAMQERFTILQWLFFKKPIEVVARALGFEFDPILA